MTKRLLTLLLLGSVLMITSCNSHSRSERADRKRAEIIASLENMDYQISVSRMDTYTSLRMSSEYFIKIKDKEVAVSLPYIGQAYNITFEEKGLNFTSEILNYEWSVSKNNSVYITFNVRTGEEYYRFLLEVYMTGTTYIGITPLNKQSISFTGEFIPNLEK